VREQAAALLGKRADEYQDVTQDSGQAVPRMGELTFVPEMSGVTFNPPRASLLWIEPVHRIEFKLMASPTLQGQTARGRLTVYLGGIILAEVTLAIRVDAGAGKSETRSEAARVRAYRKIFASYSHRDIAIVEQFETYARAVGDEYLRDWVHLRSGQVWSEQLCRLIEQADVFQLFWSHNSMRSQFVRQEWEHALSLGRPSFVRPTYWEDPLPRDDTAGLPPQALQALHFQRIGFPAPAATGPRIVESGAMAAAEVPAELLQKEQDLRRLAEDMQADLAREQAKIDLELETHKAKKPGSKDVSDLKARLGLKKGAGAPPMSAGAGVPAAGGAPPGAPPVGGEGDGLIDIRSMAGAYVGGRGAPQKAAGKPTDADLPVFSPSSLDAAPAVLLPTAAAAASHRRMARVIWAVIVLLVLGGAAALYYFLPAT
jgi:hypothetical protein